MKGLVDRGDGVALAGAGLAVDQRQPLARGCMPEGAQLFRGAGELAVVAGEDQLGAGISGPRGHHGHQPGIEHRGLVDDDGGPRRPARVLNGEREPDCRHCSALP